MLVLKSIQGRISKLLQMLRSRRATALKVVDYTHGVWERSILLLRFYMAEADLL